MTTKTPAEIVGSKLEKMYEERRNIEEQRARLAERARLLQMQIDLLESVRNEMESALSSATADVATEPEYGGDATDADDVGPTPSASGPGPTSAVLALLHDNPQGLERHKIVERLVDVIQSTSPDKRRVLYNTLINMKRRGLIKTENDAFGREVVMAEENGEAE